MNRILHKLNRLRRYFTLFERLTDRGAYYRCRHRPYLSDPVLLRPRGLSQPVFCRPRTSDAAVLWGVFGEGFHRAPVDLPPDAVIVDLGANVGYTAVDFAERHPLARVIAVEMDAENVALARRNLERFGDRCVVVHAAAWSHDGEVGYNGSEEWAYRVAPSGSADRSAPSLTMGSLFARCRIERVSYLKMDVEGAEAELLAHPEAWLGRVDSVKIEVHPPATPSTCADVLERYGFDVATDERHAGTIIGIRSPSAQRSIRRAGGNTAFSRP